MSAPTHVPERSTEFEAAAIISDPVLRRRAAAITLVHRWIRNTYEVQEQAVLSIGEFALIYLRAAALTERELETGTFHDAGRALFQPGTVLPSGQPLTELNTPPEFIAAILEDAAQLDHAATYEGRAVVEERLARGMDRWDSPWPGMPDWGPTVDRLCDAFAAGNHPPETARTWARLAASPPDDARDLEAVRKQLLERPQEMSVELADWATRGFRLIAAEKASAG